MTEGPRAEWRRRLDAADALASGPRLRRLAHRPLRYLAAVLFTRLIYPWWGRPWPRRAETFFGHPMEVLLPAGQDIFLFGAKAHPSELRLARWLLRTVQPGQHVVDVGAHYGFFSLLTAALTGPTGRVLALEASPATYRQLLRNLTPSAPAAEALNVAAADHDGDLAFFQFPPAYSEYNSTDLSQFEKTGWRRRVPARRLEIPCRRLDTLLPEKNLLPDLIKIDVEGAEAAVIAGLTGLLGGAHQPLIAMEYLHPARGNAPHRDALARLRAAGYGAFRIDADGGLLPCPDADQHLAATGLESDNLIFRRALRP